MEYTSNLESEEERLSQLEKEQNTVNESTNALSNVPQQSRAVARKSTSKKPNIVDSSLYNPTTETKPSHSIVVSALNKVIIIFIRKFKTRYIDKIQKYILLYFSTIKHKTRFKQRNLFHIIAALNAFREYLLHLMTYEVIHLFQYHYSVVGIDNFVNIQKAKKLHYIKLRVVLDYEIWKNYISICAKQVVRCQLIYLTLITGCIV